MGYFRSIYIRWWRRIEAEVRRRKSMSEKAIVLIVLQTVVVVCLLVPSQPLNDPAVQNVRIGKHIIIFNSINNLTDNTATNSSIQHSQSDGRKSNVDQFLDSRGEEADLVPIHSSSEDKDSLTMNLHEGVGKAKRPLDEIPKEAQNEERDEDAEEDPMLGRGFQEEFVTYKENEGEPILLVEDHQAEEKAMPPNTLSHNTESFDDSDVGEKKIIIDKLKKDKEDTNLRLKKDNVESVVNVMPTATREQSNDENLKKANSSDVNNDDYKFKTYDIDKPSEFLLTDDKKKYFLKIGESTSCFIEGTDFRWTKIEGGTKCHCLQDYFGDDCGIPDAVWYAKYKRKYPRTGLKQRTVPRRIINGLPVNHEFAMFEARMHELYDIVDVFLVAESNYTAHGDLKELAFYNRFHEGYLKDFQDKIVYVCLGFFSTLASNNGWIADAYIRYYMGMKGIPLLKGLRDDDLFVLSDADELPTRKVLTFLKIYDGYTEPIAFALQWNMFGFFWKMPPDDTFWNRLTRTREKMSVVTSVTTIGMLRDVLLQNPFYIRKEDVWRENFLTNERKRYKLQGHILKSWTIGEIKHYAGWHCSWCFSPENIVRKMDSAQAGDTPRWGDYPSKKNVTYIESLIWEGRWFDDKQRFFPVRNPGEYLYAPQYFLENPDEYRSLLYHPAHKVNFKKPWKPS